MPPPLRQPNPGARHLGVEYMISPKFYSSLDQEERQLYLSRMEKGLNGRDGRGHSLLRKGVSSRAG